MDQRRFHFILISVLVLLVLGGIVVNKMSSHSSDTVVGNAHFSGGPIDRDRDEVMDDVDNCAYISNADQLNQDGDVYGDGCDRCPALNTDDNFDLDQDGVGDACEERFAVIPAAVIQAPPTLVSIEESTPVTASQFCHYINVHNLAVPDVAQNRYDSLLFGTIDLVGVHRNTCVYTGNQHAATVDFRDIGHIDLARVKNYFCSSEVPESRDSHRAGGEGQFSIAQDLVCVDRLGCDVATGQCCRVVRADNFRCEGTSFINDTYTTCGSTPLRVISDCSSSGQVCNAQWDRESYGRGCMPQN